MNKHEFLFLLRKGLSGLPQDEIEERLSFYSEMIDDQMEEGLLEAEAVLEVGSVDEIVTQVIAEIPLTKIAKERVKSKRRLRVWEIILLVLGSPIWLSLGIAAFAVILAIYVSLWAVIISLWAAFISVIGLALGEIISGIAIACNGNALSGIAMLGTGIVCAGISIFSFYACKVATKGILLLTKKIVVWIKNCFIKKEEV